MIRFENQVAVVTGGAQGIGYAIAERLVREGAAVWLWDMNGPALAEVQAKLSRDVAGVKVGTALVEITDPAAAEAGAVYDISGGRATY